MSLFKVCFETCEFWPAKRLILFKFIILIHSKIRITLATDLLLNTFDETTWQIFSMWHVELILDDLLLIKDNDMTIILSYSMTIFPCSWFHTSHHLVEPHFWKLTYFSEISFSISDWTWNLAFLAKGTFHCRPFCSGYRQNNRPGKKEAETWQQLTNILLFHVKLIAHHWKIFSSVFLKL